jgi:hypothetical protein
VATRFVEERGERSTREPSTPDRRNVARACDCQPEAAHAGRRLLTDDWTTGSYGRRSMLTADDMKVMSDESMGLYGSERRMLTVGDYGGGRSMLSFGSYGRTMLSTGGYGRRELAMTGLNIGEEMDEYREPME